jgi:hypothetical protein
VDADTLDNFECGGIQELWGERISCDTPEEDYDAHTERVTNAANTTIQNFEVVVVVVVIVSEYYC